MLYRYSKVFAGILILALVVAVMGPAGAQEKITLDFPSWQATEPGTMDFWKGLIAEFESEHPGVKINFYPIPYDGYVNTMVTRFVAGDPPGIFHIPVRDLYAFTEEDWLEPMEAELGDVLDEWTPLQEWCVVDDHTVSLLVLAFGVVMAYNELLLEEAGIEEVPTTWDEMLVAATSITKDLDGDGTIDQWGYFLSTADEGHCHDYAISVVSIGLTGEKILSDDGAFNEDVFKTVVAFMRALAEAEAVPRGMSRLIGRELLPEGKIGLQIDGPWIKGFLDRASPDLRAHLKTTLPPAAAKNGVAGGVSNSLSVPKAISPEKKELVFEFIKLFATPEWQKKYGTIAGQPPARRNVFSQEELAELDPSLITAIEAAQYAVNLVPRPVATRLGEYRRVMIDSVLGYVLRGMSMEEALKSARKGVAELLE